MCLTPIMLQYGIDRKRSVPCGKCAECMELFRVQWFIRLREHKKQYNETAFVTFTYNDQSLVYGEGISPSLYPRHMQLYFKSLRKSLGDKRISYYMVGEYGTHTLRPHYHAIIFGIGRDSKEEIKRHWEYGIVHVGTVTDASLNYICKYHLLRGKAPVGCYPSFSRMSKNIGLNYVDKNKNWHNEAVIDRSFYWLNGFKKTLPRYYRDKIYSEEDRANLARLNEEKHNIKMRKEIPDPTKKYALENYEAQIKGKNRRFKRKSEEGGSF